MLEVHLRQNPGAASGPGSSVASSSVTGRTCVGGAPTDHQKCSCVCHRAEFRELRPRLSVVRLVFSHELRRQRRDPLPLISFAQPLGFRISLYILHALVLVDTLQDSTSCRLSCEASHQTSHHCEPNPPVSFKRPSRPLPLHSAPPEVGDFPTDPSVFPAPRVPGALARSIAVLHSRTWCTRSCFRLLMFTFFAGELCA